MEYIETEGETIDEAIENALKILGVERDRVTVDILAEGRKGILGFGSQKARVRASIRKSLLETEGETEREPAGERKITEEEVAAVAQKGKEVLGNILNLMRIQATIEIRAAETDEEIILDIHGGNGGLLIGRRGQTLEALQYLVTRIISERQERESPQLVVDTENYRERRQKTLKDMALRLGEKAKRQRKTMTVDSLSAADRRIIHVALQDDPWITTRSLGKGAYRRLLIIPEGGRKKKEEEKSPAAGRQGNRVQK